MKKNILLAVCILFGQLLSAGKVFVELDPASSPNRIMPSGSTNGGLLEKRGSLLIMRDDKEAAKTWKQYVFSFIPEKSGK